jgi:DNA repair exonuclease SbcCD ATPase subunit/DNA repair exonuclease SbcCD nuclease subunit
MTMDDVHVHILRESESSRARPTHVIHIADIHVRTGDAVTSRVDEYTYVFNAFCEDIQKLECVKNNTAILVICGDIFHNKGRMDSVGGKAFFLWINRLLSILPILVICGNHDFRQEDPTFTDMIDMFTAPYAALKTELYYLKETGLYSYNGILFGVTSVKDTLRLCNTSGVIEDLPPFPRPPEKQAQAPMIALFHGTISQSALPSGRQAETITKGYALDWFSGYDIVMLGDNHKQQLHTNEKTAWGYPGSLVQQDFGEPTFGHGYLLWDLATASGTMHNIPNPYSSITMTVDGIQFGNKITVPLQDALKMGKVPKFPRVRFVDFDAQSIESVISIMKESGISPSLVKCTNSLCLSPNAQVAATATSALADLNKPSEWENYMKDSVDSDIHEWINDPSTLLLPPSDFAKDSINSRNTKLRSLIEAYETELQKSTTASHLVKLSYMQWQYLMCYGKDNHFSFDDTEGHVALLNGPNASGKSAFMDILCIAMFGEPTSSRRDFSGNAMSAKIIHDSKPPGESSYVILHLYVDENKFEIYRTFTHQSASGNKDPDTVQQKIVAVYQIIDNEKYIIAEGSTMTNAWVTANIGTCEEMMMSAMLCQHDSTNFFFHKTTEQKLIIERALRMDTITAYEKVLDEAVKGHKYVLNELNAYCAGMDISMNDPVDAVAEDELSSNESMVATLRETMMKLRTKIGDDYEEYERNPPPVPPQQHTSTVCEERDDVIFVLKGHLEQRQRELKNKAVALEYEFHEDAFTVDDDETLATMRTELESHLSTMPQRPSRRKPQQCNVSLKSYDPNELIKITEEVEALRAQRYIIEHDMGEGESKSDGANACMRSLEELQNLLKEKRQNLKSSGGSGSVAMTKTECEEALAKYETWNPIWIEEIEVITSIRDELSQMGIPTTPLPLECSSWKTSEMQRVIRVHTELVSTMETVRSGIVMPVHDKTAISKWNKRYTQWRTLFDGDGSDISLSELENRKLEVETYISQVDTKFALRDHKLKILDELKGELKVLEKCEFNPECWACKKQPKVIRLQKVTQDIQGIDKEAQSLQRKLARVSKKTLTGLREELATIGPIILRRREYEASLETMQQEYDLWSGSMDAYKQYQQLSKQFVQSKETLHGLYVTLTRFINENASYKKALEEYTGACLVLEIEEIQSELYVRLNERIKELEDIQDAYELHAHNVWDAWKSRNEQLTYIIQTLELQKQYDELRRTTLEHAEKIQSLLIEKHVAYHEYKRVRGECLEQEAMLGKLRSTMARATIVAQITSSKRKELGMASEIRSVYQTRLDKLQTLQKKFTGSSDTNGFKVYIYKERVLPLLESEINAFIALVDTFKLRIRMKGSKFIFYIEDRGNTPTLDHASGYQKFIVGLGMRIALSRIGAVGQNLKHMFLDEGFVACDVVNIQKTTGMFHDIMMFGGYKSILLMSHLETVRDAATVHINITRSTDNRHSHIRWGEQEPPCRKATSMLCQAKKQGRPKKT